MMLYAMLVSSSMHVQMYAVLNGPSSVTHLKSLSSSYATLFGKTKKLKMAAKSLPVENLTIKVEKEEDIIERPVEPVENVKVVDSVTIKVEKEEDGQRPIEMVEVDDSLTIKFEEKEVKGEQEYDFDIRNMTIGNMEKMMQELTNDNKSLKKTLQIRTKDLEVCRTNIISKCKENDTTKAKLCEMKTIQN